MTVPIIEERVVSRDFFAAIQRALRSLWSAEEPRTLDEQPRAAQPTAGNGKLPPIEDVVRCAGRGALEERS